MDRSFVTSSYLLVNKPSRGGGGTQLVSTVTGSHLLDVLLFQVTEPFLSEAQGSSDHGQDPEHIIQALRRTGQAAEL